MCGIVGYSNTNVTDKDLDILKKVIIASRIRGMHASGISWWDGESIQSNIKPVPIDTLMDSLTLSNFKYGKYNKAISLIAHTRYSTSDIQYNQPLVGKRCAIAMNGVITQSPPETWLSTYGYECETNNDAELLLQALENRNAPFIEFPEASYAVVVLEPGGHVGAFRNPMRPLWRGVIGDGVVYASTYAILNIPGVRKITKVPTLNSESDLQTRTMG